VLVVDEPTLGLAPLIVEQLALLFRELRDDGTAILLVEEKMRAVESMADHLAFIRLGAISWSGRVDEIDRDTVASHYLGPSEPKTSQV
jgi:branched-chain amino acid transport system ATP-binding protein